MKENDMQSVEEMLGKLETADNTTKNKIENILERLKNPVCY